MSLLETSPLNTIPPFCMERVTWSASFVAPVPGPELSIPALSPPMRPHGTYVPSTLRLRTFQRGLSSDGSQRGGGSVWTSRGAGATKRAVERGPTGSVSPTVFLLSTKPVYAPRPVYCLTSFLLIFSHRILPFSDSSGPDTDCGAAFPASW